MHAIRKGQVRWSQRAILSVSANSFTPSLASPRKFFPREKASTFRCFRSDYLQHNPCSSVICLANRRRVRPVHMRWPLRFLERHHYLSCWYWAIHVQWRSLCFKSNNNVRAQLVN
jgi:hypothetical protein